MKSTKGPKRTLIENATSGSTSAGNISSAPSVLNYGIHRRIPKFEIHDDIQNKTATYSTYKPNNEKKKK